MAFPLKRIYDIVAASLALLFFAPLLLVLAFLIKSVSKGPIFYTQERIGFNGRPFRLIKLRTMHVNAEERLKELLESSAALRKEWESSYKLKEDPRIHPLGHFLRVTSLDEIPQFWNVLKGEMSIVGPRPVTAPELENAYGAHKTKLLSVKPGLTGPWQLSGRSNTSYQKRIFLDMYYIRYQSLGWDIILTLRTIPAMLFPKGAY